MAHILSYASISSGPHCPTSTPPQIATSFFRPPSTFEPLPGPALELGRDGSGMVDHAMVVKSIKEDFERSYFVTMSLRLDAYEEDYEFADPATSFRGLQRFKRKCTNFGSLLVKSNMKLMKGQGAEGPHRGARPIQHRELESVELRAGVVVRPDADLRRQQPHWKLEEWLMGCRPHTTSNTLLGWTRINTSALKDFIPYNGVLNLEGVHRPLLACR
ncbi:hypothetical protein ACFX2A_000439 [Malus domestica]